jgi:hypothetical protein
VQISFCRKIRIPYQHEYLGIDGREEMDLGKIELKDMDWINVARDKDR